MYPFTIFCKFIKLEILRPNFAKKMSDKNFDKINMKTKICIKFLPRTKFGRKRYECKEF